MAGGVCLATLTASMYRLAPNRLGRAFLALGLASAVWSVGYAFELLSPDLGSKVFFAQVQYLGILTASVAWFCVAVAFTGRARWLSFSLVSKLSIPPIIVLMLVWTNDWHGLVWAQLRIVSVYAHPILEIRHGPAFWANVAYSYALLFAASALLAGAMFSAQRLFTLQQGLLLAAALWPWIGNSLYLMRIEGLRGIDPTPFAFGLSAVTIAYAMQHGRLLRIVPVSRHRIFESIDAAAFVLDVDGTVVDVNPAAQQLLGVRHEAALGEHIGTWLGDIREVLEELASVRSARPMTLIDAEGRTRHFELALYPIRNSNNVITTRLLILDDVTRRLETAEASEHLRQESPPV